MSIPMSVLEYDLTAALQDHWTTLVTRETARRLLADLLKLVTTHTTTIVLDFDMVSLIDASFADAFLVPLLRKARGRWRVIGVNASPSVAGLSAPAEQLDTLMRKNKVAFLLVAQDGVPHLIGARAPKAAAVLRNLWAAGRLTLDQVLVEHDLDEDAGKQTAEYLIEMELSSVMTSRQGIPVYEADRSVIASGYAAFGFLAALERRLNEDKGVLERGHFVLPSGAHLDRLYHTQVLLRQARLARRVGWEMAKRLSPADADLVVTPETHGCLILAHAAALSLGGDCVMETARQMPQGGGMRLSARTSRNQARTCVIVVDVVATGFVVRSLIREAERLRYKVGGICCLLDVSGHRTVFPQYQYSALVSFDNPLYPSKSTCPLCGEGDLAPVNARILPEKWA